MNRHTGGAITEQDHITQSVTDILTTRIGTRVMRRDYGSLLPELIDQPHNEATRLRVYAATVMALMAWEPRITLSAVHLDTPALSGSSVLEIEAKQNDTNAPLNLRIPLQLGAAS